jgi:hypothetical protein
MLSRRAPFPHSLSRLLAHDVLACRFKFYLLFQLSMELVLCRRFPKIRYRVLRVNHLVEDDSMTRLESWEPGPEDASNFALVGQSMLLLSDAPTGEIWVEIPIVLHLVFDSRRIRKQLGDGVACYQFEAFAWLKCLSDIFRFQDLVRDFRDGDKDLFEDYRIHVLVNPCTRMSTTFDAILRIPSLIHLLNSLRSMPTLTRLQGDGGVQAEEPEEPEFTPEHWQTFSTIYQDRMHAVVSLNQSKLFRSGLDMSLMSIPHMLQMRAIRFQSETGWFSFFTACCPYRFL